MADEIVRRLRCRIIERLSKELCRLLPELGLPPKETFDRESFAEALGSAMGRLSRLYPCCFWVEAMALALQANAPEVIAAAYRNLAYVHEYSSEFASACGAFETALDLCRREDLTQAVESCRGCLAYAFFRRGEWKQARSICREILSEPASSDVTSVVFAK